MGTFDGVGWREQERVSFLVAGGSEEGGSVVTPAVDTGMGASEMGAEYSGDLK